MPKAETPSKVEPPLVGDIIRVVMPNTSPVLRSLFPNMPEEVSYEGTVLPRNTWLLEGEFNLSSDDSRYPIRTIQIRSCLRIEKIGENRELPYFHTAALLHGVRIFKVQGKSGVYKVTVAHDKTAHCECQGFAYRGKCSHIPKNMDQFLADNTPDVPVLPDPNRGGLTDSDLYPGVRSRAKRAGIVPASKKKTATVHIKKAMVLGDKGEKGQAQKTKRQLCIELIEKYGKTKSGPEYVQLFMKRAGMTIAGARTYYASLKAIIK